MKLAGIIAEYDPFHNGHAWQLAQAKALGAGRVAVAMSCGLTQRGALPLLPEAVRVRAALICGADLVFALPAPCACAGAEAFARAGVRVLSAAGCDALVFGAETPDAALLMEAARVLCSEDYRAALKAQLAAGARSFAAARQAAVEALCPGTELAALLDKPNNNLAVEYCKAILELGVSMAPVPLPRQGAGHGEALSPDAVQFASASALRQLWQSGGADAAAPYVPRRRPAPLSGSLRRRAVHRFRRCGPLRAGPAPGQVHRAGAFCRGAGRLGRAGTPAGARRAHQFHPPRTAGRPDHRALSPRPDAPPCHGCRRAGYDAALPPLPPYLHLLGARREALSLLKGATLPVSHSLMRLREEDAPCARMADAQLAASDLGALCRKTPEPMGGLLRQKIVF